MRDPLSMGVEALKASDHQLGLFALVASRVVNSRMTYLDEDNNPRPGAKELAVRAGVSTTLVENHAIAYQLRRALIKRGYHKVVVEDLWPKLYKSHWIAAARSWRRHQDLEIALTDLHYYLENRITPEGANSAADDDVELGEFLHKHAATIEKQLSKVWAKADKNRHLLTKVRKLREIVTKQYLPLVAEIIEADERHKKAQKSMEELGYRKGVYL